MKRFFAVITTLAVLLLPACSSSQSTTPGHGPSDGIRGTQDVLLNEQDRDALSLTPNHDEESREQLGITGNETYCRTEETYAKNVTLSRGAYSICTYNVSSLNNTDVVVQIKRFADYASLNGSYQYDSSHYFSSTGLISTDELGDQSTFRRSTDDDYGGEQNPDDVHYYHLWVTKDLYLVHVTSSGSEDAKNVVTAIAERILDAFPDKT